MPRKIDTPENYVKASEFIALTAKECRYHVYEVKDVYNAMLQVLERMVLEEKEFNLGKLFSIRYAKIKVREFNAPGKTGEKRLTTGGTRIKVKASRKINERVRDISIGKLTVDEALALSYGQYCEDTLESESFE